MSHIRCVYRGAAPAFPARDQHPQATRYGPFVIDGETYFVDAIGGKPEIEEISAVIARPPLLPAAAKLDQHLTSAIAELSAPSKGTPAMKPAAAGLNVKEMMEEHTRLMGEIHQAQIKLLQTSLARQRDTVATAVGTIASQVDDQTDEFLSIMGQFSNGLGLG